MANPEPDLDLERRLAEGPPLLLDGATGTELERRGLACGLPLWSARALLEAPALLERIHREYARAGVEAVTACTFRTQRRSLARAGLGERAAELTGLAVERARAGAPGCRVLGSAPPLEDCYRPDLVPDPASLEREHREHAANLAAAGADAVLAETLNCVREARAVLAAAREAGLPALASFVCDADARLLSGEPLAEAIDAVEPLAPLAIGVNCLPPDAARACLPVLAGSGVRFGVYANLGPPDDPLREACTPRTYAAHAQEWIAAGARFVGGCCGTSPAHLAEVAAQVTQGRA